MPVDRYTDEDDDDHKKEVGGGNARFKEFDCPGCNANNPVDFSDGDELLCNYCGCSFKVKVSDEGKVKLREL